jgi:hypothetical protein
MMPFGKTEYFLRLTVAVLTGLGNRTEVCADIVKYTCSKGQDSGQRKVRAGE